MSETENLVLLLFLAAIKDNAIIDKFREEVKNLFDREEREIKEVEKAIDNGVSLEELMEMPMPNGLRKNLEEVIEKEKLKCQK